MARGKRVCKICGQPIHKSRVASWGWMHSKLGNYDHLPVLKKGTEGKEV